MTSIQVHDRIYRKFLSKTPLFIMSRQYNGDKKALYTTRLEEGMWMRKSHNIEEKPGDDMIHIVSPTHSSEQEHTPSFMYTWLQSLMEHLAAYFGECIPRDDLDLLNLSLYHLYRSVDRLYSTTLPHCNISLKNGSVVLPNNSRYYSPSRNTCHLLPSWEFLKKDGA